MNDSERDRQWAVTAVTNELDNIARCTAENAHKPGSEWWACVLRIASVIKGSGRQHISPEDVRIALHGRTPSCVGFKPSREKGIDYLFHRAMNWARPRYRIISAPTYMGGTKPGGSSTLRAGSSNSQRHR